MNRILVDSEELQGVDVVLEDHRADHIRRVLRAEAGKSIRMGVLNGPKGQGFIHHIDDARVELSLEFEREAPPRPGVNLVLALPRPKVMKRLWAPLSSLGVDRIVLLNAEKVEKDYWSSHTLREDRYRPLLIEGLQQSGDTQLPEIEFARSFRSFTEEELPSRSRNANRLLADEGAAPPFLSLLPLAHDASWLALGPEGGWNTCEVEGLQQAGFTSFSLGSRILRSDVACISALSLLVAAQG